MQFPTNKMPLHACQVSVLLAVQRLALCQLIFWPCSPVFQEMLEKMRVEASNKLEARYLGSSEEELSRNEFERMLSEVGSCTAATIS